MIVDSIIDAGLDCLKMLPFLFVAFLALEAMEQRSGEFMNRVLKKVGKSGPIVGAVLGCIPQCGFSVLAANLYAGSALTLGTLIAVFLSTSDEAILIFLGNPGRGKEILWLIGVKVCIAVLAGYGVDLFVRKKKATGFVVTNHHEHGEKGIFVCALGHTIKIFLYLFVFTIILNLALEWIGLENLSEYLMKDSIFQPIIAGMIGLIPNCAASVILSQLYLTGVISFASVVAGLCSGAGVGLVVLHRMNKNKKENWMITGLLYMLAVTAGMVLQAAGW